MCWQQELAQGLVSWLGAFVIAWATAKWALNRDREAWAKEVDQPAFDDCQSRIDGIAEWARSPRRAEYPFVNFMRLERGFHALGANSLLPALREIRSEADRYNTEFEKLTMNERGNRTRKLYRDLMSLGIRLHNHRRKQLGLRVQPFRPEDIDAGL